MSQVTMEVKSETTPLRTSTTDIHGQPVEVRRKRGRPPKRKNILIEAKKVQDPAGLDAGEQKECSDKIPCTATVATLPECLADRNSANVLDCVVSPIIDDPPHSEMSGPHSVSDCKPENIPVLPKRKRGRPRKSSITALKEKIPVAADDDVHADKDSGPAKRLRSREQHTLTPDGKKHSDVKVNLSQNQMTPTVHVPSKNKPNSHGLKRGRPKLADKKIPSKVSRLALSQEASSMLSSEAGCGERVETDKQANLNAEEKKGHRCPKSRVRPQRRKKLRKGVVPQMRLRSTVASGPIFQVTPQSQHSLNLVSPRGSVPGPEMEHSVNINGSDKSKTHSRVGSPHNTNPGEPSQNTKPGDPPQNTKPGDSPQNTKPGDSPQNTKPGDSPQNMKPGDSPQNTKPIDSPQNTKPSDSPQITIPGDPPQDTKLGDSSQNTKPSDSPQNTKPGESPQITNPGDSPQNTKPGDSPQNAKPGDSQLNTKPGDSRQNTKPGDSPQNTKPGDSPQNTKPGDSLQNTKPGESQQNTKPGDSPQNTKPCCSDVRSSTGHKEPPTHVGIPSNVKAEDIEMELDHFNSISVSNSQTSLHHNANTTVKSECPDSRQGTFGRRRRKRRNLLLQKEHHAVPNQCHEAITEAQKRPGSSESDEGNLSGRSTKPRRKSQVKCKDCGRTFKFLSQYVVHQRIHTGERPFKCLECGKDFTKNSNLNLHLKTHKKSSASQTCPYCKIEFSCSEYTSHMEMHSRQLNQGSEKGRSETLSRRNDHGINEAPHTSVTSERRDVKPTCQYCGKTFPFQSALIRHERVHTGEKPFKCDICGKAFGQAYFLRVHELTHWSVKRYNCTICGKSFAHYSNATNHSCRFFTDNEGTRIKRRAKPSLSYTCHICQNTLFQLQEFNNHMKAHSGAKLYRCLVCDKLFGVLAEFNDHRSRCNRARGASDSPTSLVKDEDTVASVQYSVKQDVTKGSSGHNSFSPVTAVNCETQEKSSHTSPQASQTHGTKCIINVKKPFQSTTIPSRHLPHLVSRLNKLDNRSDPRQYLCPSCGRLFRHMGRLRAHMLTHARGQSYTCGCCGKTLENWKKLWHHQRIHRQRRGRFTCPQCGQGFRFVEPYKRHMAEHPEFQWIQEKPKKVSLPYQCEQCGTSFRTLDLLFNHQLCHSSTQDIHKNAGYDLALDDRIAHSNRRMINAPINNHMTMCRPEPQQNNFSPSSSFQMDNPHEGPLLKSPVPVPPEPPVIPFTQHQSPDSCKTVQQPRSTHLYQNRETSQDRIGENAIGKQIETLKTVRRHVTQKAVGLETCEGSSDGMKCAVCGNAYPTISDLYQHYLKHARGQL